MNDTIDNTSIMYVDVIKNDINIRVTDRFVNSENLHTNNINLLQVIKQHSKDLQHSIANLKEAVAKGYEDKSNSTGFPYGWCHCVVEATNFDDVKDYDNIVRCLALIKVAKHHLISEVSITGNNNRMIDMIEALFLQENFIVTIKRSRLAVPKTVFKIYSLIHSFIRGFAGLVYYSSIYWFRYRAVDNKYQNCDLLVIDHLDVSSVDILNGKNINSPIWGDFFEANRVEGKKK